jgi:Tol biopolymer transport system component
MEESTPETYTFSEPKVVLTEPDGMFSISEWLPDSQRVLVERTVAEKGQVSSNSIELFNPVKVKTQIYAETFYGLPIWVSSLDSILYQEFVAESGSYDASGNYIPPSSDTAHVLLLLSNGNPNNTQTIDDSQYNHFRVSQNNHPTSVYSSPAVKPDGSEIVYLKANGEIYQFYSRKISQGQFDTEQLLPIDSNILKNNTITRYEMAWRPYTEQIFFVGNADYYGRAQEFLFDMNTGKFCTFNFGLSSWFARWSPNGRYLAIIRGGAWFPIDFSDLAVLDTATGNLYTMAFSPDVEGRHYVWDIAWAPDSYHLVAIGQVGAYQHCAPNCMDDVNRMYLVDFISGKADLIFPSFQFSSGDIGENLAWSPDGTKILAQCRTEKVARLCLIPVHINGK